MEPFEKSLQELEECIHLFKKHIFSFYIEDVTAERVVRYVSLPTPVLKRVVELCEHVARFRSDLKGVQVFRKTLKRELLERENAPLSESGYRNTFYTERKKERMKLGGSFLAVNRKRLARHTKIVFEEWSEIRSFLDGVLSEIKKA